MVVDGVEKVVEEVECKEEEGGGVGRAILRAGSGNDMISGSPVAEGETLVLSRPVRILAPKCCT